MTEINRRKGLTRRDLIKTVGLGGVAATGLNVAEASGASESGEGKAPAVPKRKLGKTGLEVSMLCDVAMFT